MGKKSDKKVNSDRISVLRKQYDSFLEEDKRRKERNDYILGQLDKMRVTTSSGLVLRHRKSKRLPEFVMDPPPPLVLNDHENPINTQQSVYEPHLTRKPQIQSLMPIRPSISAGEELLREISKKYILIPKIDQRCTLRVPEQHKSPDNENDWKSKYDILDELKKNEKESVELARERSSDITNPVLKANNENNFIPKAMLDSMKPRQGLNINMIYDEVPERDVSLNKNLDDAVNREKTEKYEEKHKEFNQTSDKNQGVVCAVKASNNTVNVEDAVFYDYNTNADVAYEIDPVDHTQVSKRDSHPIYTDQNYNINESILEKPHQQIEFEDKGQTEIPEKDYFKEEFTVINPEDITEEIAVNNEEAAVVHHGSNIEAENNTEYPNDIHNSEDFTAGNIIVKHEVNVNSPEYEEAIPAVVEINSAVTPNKNTTPEYDLGPDSVNTLQKGPETEQVPYAYEEQYQQNPEFTGMNENNNPADNAAGIEEFEQENAHMFYSSTEGADGYNVEYTGEEANYETNQEYQYYEGQRQIEYAENAADQQPYDQNYEQQYGQQPFELQEQSHEQQQQGYEQQPQGYEQQQQEQVYYHEQQINDPLQQADDQQVENQPEGYNQQLYYEQNTPKMPQIEQQLDQEQSFVDPTPVVEEKADPKLIIVAD